jgi:hypothetical protein
MTKSRKLQETISFRVNPTDRDEILRISEQQNVKVSTVVRSLLHAALAADDRNQPVSTR